MSRLWLAHPEWWPGLVAVVAATGALLLAAGFVAGRRLRRLLPAVDAQGRGFGPLARRLAIRRLGDGLLLAALVAIALALLGPRIGREEVWISTSGTDVVVLLDVSRSMDARDVPPSRVDRARRTARDLLERLDPESRAALAAFSGRGVLLTPLTPDTAALVEMLPALDSDLVRPGGSDLERGVLAALDAFEETSRRPRVLVVLSDGEDLVGSGSLGRVEAQRAEARVVAAAFGSPHGATIPDHGVPLRDGEGEIVVTRRTKRGLERLTEGTGGALFLSDEWGAVDVDAMTRAVQRDARPAEGGGGFARRRLTVPMVLPFAAAAFVLLGLEWATAAALGRRGTRSERSPQRRRSGPLRAALPTAAAGVAAALAALSPPAAGVATPADPTSAEARIQGLESLARGRSLTAAELVRLGVARAEAGRLAQAEQAFVEAALRARDPQVAAIAQHNRGVAALDRGDLETARDRFFDALASDPDLARSRFNLEWTLTALGTQPPDVPPATRRAAPDEPDQGERPEPTPEPEPQVESPEPAEAPPERTAAPRESADAPGSADGSAGAPPPETLDPAQRDRLLAGVRDDAGRALRAAAESGRGKVRRRSTPTW